MSIIYFQSADEGPVYVAEVLANLTKESAKSKNSALIKPHTGGGLGEMQVRQFKVITQKTKLDENQLLHIQKGFDYVKFVSKMIEIH